MKGYDIFDHSITGNSDAVAQWCATHVPVRDIRKSLIPCPNGWSNQCNCATCMWAVYDDTNDTGAYCTRYLLHGKIYGQWFVDLVNEEES